jgi:hypothetical protein
MLKKKYLKSGSLCKVTFRLEKNYVGDVDTIDLLGDMNQWDPNGTTMKKIKNGCFTLNLNLESNRDYQFRYLVNRKYWINDDAADSYLPSPFPGVDNSVVSV